MLDFGFGGDSHPSRDTESLLQQVCAEHVLFSTTQSLAQVKMHILWTESSDLHRLEGFCLFDRANGPSLWCSDRKQGRQSHQVAEFRRVTSLLRSFVS